MSEWSDWYRHEDPTTWVLPTILRQRAAEHPDRDYLRYADGPWLSYAEIDAAADRMANALGARGIGPGHTVSMLMPNSVENVITWFGILRAGARQCPINVAYRGDFLSWAINLPQARTLVVAGSLLDRLEEVAGELPLLERVITFADGDPKGTVPRGLVTEDLAALLDGPEGDPGIPITWTDDSRVMFTSGTTGRSKGVIKQHASDYFSARTYIEVCDITADDTLFTCLPLFHSNAQVLAIYPAMVAGARIALVDRYSASRFWDQVRDAGATALNTVSAMNYFIWNTPPSGADRAHPVRRIMAMPAPKDIYHEFEERFGIRFHEGYGLTETGMVSYVPPAAGPRPGSCGQATPGFEIFVVDPATDQPLPPNTPGEIVVDMKLPNIVMRAYAGMPEKTVEDFRNLKLHTGDLGRIDEDGYLYFMDRVKDYIRRRGENVSSMEVERIVVGFPGISEAAAVGVKATTGAGAEEEILVCVVCDDGSTLDLHALLEHCASRMPYFAVPRYVRLVDHLPKTPTERVRKVVLRDEGLGADYYDREISGPALER